MIHSRDLLYNIVSIINTKLCSSKFVKSVDLLSVLTTKKEKNGKRHKEILGSVEYVYYFDGSDSITGVCIFPKLSKCAH